MSDVHDLQQIETALAAILTEPLTALGCRTVEVFHGEIEEIDPPEVAKTRRFPLVWIAADGLEVTQRNQVDLAVAGITLIVADGNRRGVDTAVYGDEQSPGVYRLLLENRRLLNGRTILKPWAAVDWLGDLPIIRHSETGLAAYAQGFETKRALRR
jgi:hypothetical protein